MECALNFASHLSTKRRPLPRATLLTIAWVVALLPLTASAQSVQPSAQQMRVINQLPPAQRRQALQAIEQMNASQGRIGQEPGEDGDDAGAPQPSLRTPSQTQIEPTIPEAQAGARLVIEMHAIPELQGADLEALRADPALRRLEGSHYFELDDDGVLELPGIARVPLAGLTEEGIRQRLGAEPALNQFHINAIILPQAPVGVAALETFGYEVFQPPEGGLDTGSAGPVPADYVLGPGDTIRVQLYGSVNRVDDLEVSRDGTLHLPEIGPMSVVGLQFQELRNDLQKRVASTLIGTQVSVSMGELRAIQVFVMGDVVQPGSYVVNSMATMSTALYYGGGISQIGSLRDIKLKRRGREIVSLDLYDLLLGGDSSNDHRLQAGDVIFVPAQGPTVGVAGAVRRPAIYELKGEISIDDVIRMAGGLLPNAFPDGLRIERIGDSRERIILTAGSGGVSGDAAVRPGDMIIVPEVLDELAGSIELAGHVQRPGPYQYEVGMRLSDLLPTALHLRTGADIDYVLIRRVDPRTRQISVRSASLSQAWAAPGDNADIRLQARDTVHVFNRAFGRQRVIEPILEELRIQAHHGEPHRVAEIAGAIKAPGTYPVEDEMRISDLIRAGGDLSEGAYALRAELTRYEVVGGQYRETDVNEVDLSAILAGDDSADLPVEAHDFLRISLLPDWDTQSTVVLEGEVVFTGSYRIRRGETLRDVIERAGGLTNDAYPQGAIFLRESLRKREQEQVDKLVSRLETDLASLSLQSVDTTGSETLTTGRALLDQLRETEAVGRLVIDLQSIVGDNTERSSQLDVRLQDGDRLLVPSKPQVVTVIGEVQQNTSHLFQPELGRDDYLNLSGGLTRRADKQLIYVVRSSGAVVAGSRSRWFSRGRDFDILPGDTIVVPLETDRIRPLTFWTNVSQIFYQSAIAVAAIRTFND